VLWESNPPSHLDHIGIKPTLTPTDGVYINFELKVTLEFSQDYVARLFNYVLRFVHADTAVKENQMEKHLPLTTKSGLRIGCMYSPPPQNHMTHDAELLQMALLNIEPEFSQRRIAGWIAYALFLVALYTALVVWEL
jgi:hypothetical protein